jgi:hypothetical protein
MTAIVLHAAAQTGTSGALCTPTNVDLTRRLPSQVYPQVLAELCAIPKNEILGINVDIRSAIVTALGGLATLRTLGEALGKALRDFDVAEFDRLETYTLALIQADAAYRGATQPPDGLEATVVKCLGLREILWLEAELQIQRGRIPKGSLKRLTRNPGYKHLATTVCTLAALLTTHYAAIEGRCSVTYEELVGAENLAIELLRIVGWRQYNARQIDDTTDMRKRAFTAFARAYDNIRRAVIYLRWHQGDADAIMPSLYRGHGGKRRKRRDSRDKGGSAANQYAQGSNAAETPLPGET